MLFLLLLPLPLLAEGAAVVLVLEEPLEVDVPGGAADGGLEGLEGIEEGLERVVVRERQHGRRNEGKGRKP